MAAGDDFDLLAVKIKAERDAHAEKMAKLIERELDGEKRKRLQHVASIFARYSLRDSRLIARMKSIAEAV